MSGGHTEGPWSTARDVGHLRVNDRHGLVICKVAQNRRNAVADLRLLAAAPDLLSLADAFEAYLLGDGCADDHPLVVEARAAIAKARGDAVSPFLKNAMARAEVERLARLEATPPAELPRGPHGNSVPLAARPSRRLCECGAPADRFNRKLSAYICGTCAARDSLRIPLKERAAQVVRLARRLDGVTADDVAAAVSITRGHANSVLSRLVRQGRLRRLSGVGEYEVAS